MQGYSHDENNAARFTRPGMPDRGQDCLTSWYLKPATTPAMYFEIIRWCSGWHGRARLTVPNLITLIRLLLVPSVVFALLTGYMGWAFAGFLLAGISDGIDGFIARHFDQRSELGAYLDPMADKLLLVSVFVVLGYMGELPLWLVIAAVSRDALIVSAVLLSTIMSHPVKVRPLFVSKANTLVQIVLAALVLGELALG